MPQGNHSKYTCQWNRSPSYILTQQCWFLNCLRLSAPEQLCYTDNETVTVSQRSNHTHPRNYSGVSSHPQHQQIWGWLSSFASGYSLPQNEPYHSPSKFSVPGTQAGLSLWGLGTAIRRMTPIHSMALYSRRSAVLGDYREHASDSQWWAMRLPPLLHFSYYRSVRYCCLKL